MTEQIKTNFVLGSMGGMPALLNEYTSLRDPLRNEKTERENGFIEFANARNLPELLIALDDIHDMNDCYMTDIIPSLISMEGEKPEPLDDDDATEICSFFNDPNPTRTTLEKTREAMREWGYPKAQAAFEVMIDRGNGPEPGTAMNQFFPLEDIVKASEDLRRTSLLMAWLLGKTSFKTAHGLPDGDRTAKMRTMDAEEPVYLYRYYEKLANNTGNAFDGLNIHARVDQMHLYREQDIESTVSSYVEAAFNLLLSDERTKIAPGLFVYRSSNTILSAAWTFFAEGLNKKDGPGAIGVCKHCHRFFEQQRSTKQFCSDSCRVMYLRNHEGDNEPEDPYVTTVCRFREEQRKQANAHK